MSARVYRFDTEPLTREVEIDGQWIRFQVVEAILEPGLPATLRTYNSAPDPLYAAQVRLEDPTSRQGYAQAVVAADPVLSAAQVSKEVMLIGVDVRTFIAGKRRQRDEPQEVTPPSGDAPAHDEEGSPTIDVLPELDAGEQDLQVITAAAWAALQAANDPPHLFRHGGMPVRLERDENATPVLRELTLDRVRHHVARSARWYAVRDRDGVLTRKDAMPPIPVVRDMLAIPEPPLPVLLRVVQVPVFAPDGMLQTTHGYHPASQTYYAPTGGFSLYPVPQAPTAAQRQRARDYILQELLGDFSFVDAADKAHAVALLLEPFVRDLIDGPTPLHMFEASTPGSGKGLLADVVLFPAVGHHVGVIPQVTDDAEWRKQLTARFIEARLAILIDNVTRPLQSAVLAAALTAVVWDDRPLGKSETVHPPVRCAWVATGNNPTMTTEIARRTVRSRLDPKVDRPWLREDFHHADLRGWATAHRAELVWAGLVLGQAWLTAGRPAPSCKPLGSYEAWSRVVGGILEYAGIPGFLANLDTFYEQADAEGAIWRQFVSVWWEKFADTVVKAADLFPLIDQVDGFDVGGKTDRAQRTAFGMKLGHLRDRVIGDYRVAKCGTEQRVSRWQLLPTQTPHGAS